MAQVANAFLALLIVGLAPAQAQNYPTKPIHVIVPYAPGGVADIAEWRTLQDLGVPDVDASNWVAMFAPKATPQPIIDKLNAEPAKILAMPDVKEKFAAGSAETLPMSPADLDGLVRKDTERLKVIVEKANLKPD